MSRFISIFYNHRKHDVFINNKKKTKTLCRALCRVLYRFFMIIKNIIISLKKEKKNKNNIDHIMSRIISRKM